MAVIIVILSIICILAGILLKNGGISVIGSLLFIWVTAASVSFYLQEKDTDYHIVQEFNGCLVIGDNGRIINAEDIGPCKFGDIIKKETQPEGMFFGLYFNSIQDYYIIYN